MFGRGVPGNKGRLTGAELCGKSADRYCEKRGAHRDFPESGAGKGAAA